MAVYFMYVPSNHFSLPAEEVTCSPVPGLPL